MKFSKVFIAIATATSIQAVQAQNSQPQSYFGVELGSAKVNKNVKDEFARDLVEDGGGTAVATQNSSIKNYKIIGGYKFTENFDFEVGYWKTSKLNVNFSGVDGNGVSYSGNANVSYSGFEYSAIIRPDLSTGWNNAYLKVGGHQSKAENNSTVTPGSIFKGDSDSTSGSGALIGVGYDHPISQQTSLRFALTRYNNVAGAGGNAEFVSVGAIYKF